MNKEVLALAIRAHEGQTRRFSGDVLIPYVVHPIEVAFQVQYFCVWNNQSTKGMMYDSDLLVNASLLHDVLEDCPHISKDEIQSIAGEEVLALVVELTNPSKGSKLSRPERKAMDREHLSKVSQEAKIIKLIDRTCNLRDLGGADEDFKRTYLDESRLLLEVIGNVDEFLQRDYHDAMLELHESLSPYYG